jgi:hypothetical protein
VEKVELSTWDRKFGRKASCWIDLIAAPLKRFRLIELCAIIISAEYDDLRIQFFTPNEFFKQIASMSYPSGSEGDLASDFAQAKVEFLPYSRHAGACESGETMKRRPRRNHTRLSNRK